MSTEKKRAGGRAYYRVHKAELAAYARAYRNAHKDEIAAKAKASYKAHKEERVAYYNAYYQTHKQKVAARQQAHKEQRAIYQKGYRKSRKAEHLAYLDAHKVEIMARRQAYQVSHKSEIAAYQRAYAKAHPDRFADKAAKRRALRGGATVEIVSRHIVYQRDAGRCHLCGKKVPKRGWHLDHLIPLARGGEHSYRNVAVSCPKCNTSKGTKAKAQLRLI